jgi:aspartate aminotransferase
VKGVQQSKLAIVSNNRSKPFRPPARLQGIQKSPIRQLHDRAKPGSINMGLGEPDLPTPDVVRRAASRIVLEEQNGYSTHAGIPALRDLICADYPHMDLQPDQVIVTAGSQEALYLALMTLVDDGDEVLLPDPGFVAYPTIVKMAGGKVRTYRMPAADGFLFDRQEFHNALTERTKVVVCISPSNPTGRVLDNTALRAIAEELAGTGIYVVSDEIYRELYYSADRPASISDFYQPTIVINGLSKAMSMTGWRLGWMCGDKDVIASALVLHGYVTTCASTVSQKAALSAWTSEAQLARSTFRSVFRARRDHLLALIESELQLEAFSPEGAFYTMLDTGKQYSSMSVAETLLDHGVITVPGSAFGVECEGFLRVSFCAPEEILSEGVRRMQGAFKALK